VEESGALGSIERQTETSSGSVSLEMGTKQGFASGLVLRVEGHGLRRIGSRALKREGEVSWVRGRESSCRALIGPTGRRMGQRKNDKRRRRCCAIRSNHMRCGRWRGYGTGECWSARGEGSRTARARCSTKRWLTERARERTKGTKQRRGLACYCP
jgi:hypothetical protein